jgi:hypothetical protein
MVATPSSGCTPGEHPSAITVSDPVNRPLRVERLLATHRGDAERGPAVWMHPDDARSRLLVDGELAWVYDVVLRDVAGASPSEIVRVIKPDLDRGRRGSALA